jgi:hypothetical protein
MPVFMHRTMAFLGVAGRMKSVGQQSKQRTLLVRSSYSMCANSYRGCLVTFWVQSVSTGSASVGVM